MLRKMQIPLDKWVHFLGGYIVAREVGRYNPLVGLAAATVVGIGKEVWDSRTHAPDKIDAFATVLGGLLGSLICVVELGLN